MNHWVPRRKALRRFDLMFRRTVSSLTLRWDAAWGTVNSSGMFMAQSYKATMPCCSILQHHDGYTISRPVADVALRCWFPLLHPILGSHRPAAVARHVDQLDNIEELAQDSEFDRVLQTEELDRAGHDGDQSHRSPVEAPRY